MYIAGSHTLRDFYDDVVTGPFWGSVKDSERYQQAEKMLKANPLVRTNIVHAFGGAVSHELQKDHPGLRTVTYGSPTISLGNVGGEGRCRNAWDPVSMFDRGAVQQTHPNPTSFNALTHDYHNNTNVSSKDGSLGYANADNTVSITE